MKKYGKTIGLLAVLILLVAGAGIAYTALKDQVDAPSALGQMTQTADGSEEGRDDTAEESDAVEDGTAEDGGAVGEDSTAEEGGAVEGDDTAEADSAEKDGAADGSETAEAGQDADSGTDAEADDTSSQRQQAVDFTVFDAEGQEVKLSDFFGKPVVVNFWATWCGYCKQEMPDFQEVYEEYKDQVHFLMIQSTDGSRETKEMGEAYIQEEGYSFPVYYDENREAVYVYSVYSLPTTILLDAEGRVAAYNPGLVEKEPLTAAIETLLEEQESG